MKPLDGAGRQSCREHGCGRRSIAGRGLCPYHWAAAVWGPEWARKLYPHYTAGALRHYAT